MPFEFLFIDYHLLFANRFSYGKLFCRRRAIWSLGGEIDFTWHCMEKDRNRAEREDLHHTRLLASISKYVCIYFIFLGLDLIVTTKPSFKNPSFVILIDPVSFL